MKKLNIELNHHNRSFGPDEEIRYAVGELYEALGNGRIETGTFENKKISGKVETDNFVIQILPK